MRFGDSVLSDSNATKRPLSEIDALKLGTALCAPCEPTLARVVLGLGPAATDAATTTTASTSVRTRASAGGAVHWMTAP
jgi:hypothetical protein